MYIEEKESNIERLEIAINSAKRVLAQEMSKPRGKQRKGFTESSQKAHIAFLESKMKILVEG